MDFETSRISIFIPAHGVPQLITTDTLPIDI